MLITPFFPVTTQSKAKLPRPVFLNNYENGFYCLWRRIDSCWPHIELKIDERAILYERVLWPSLRDHMLNLNVNKNHYISADNWVWVLIDINLETQSKYLDFDWFENKHTRKIFRVSMTESSKKQDLKFHKKY